MWIKTFLKEHTLKNVLEKKTQVKGCFDIANTQKDL